MASMALVLLLLALGSLLLAGIHQQYQALSGRVASEARRMRDAAEAHSALEWGRRQPWSSEVTEQCRQPTEIAGSVCLRIFTDGALLLIASGGAARRWLSGEVAQGAVVFLPHGWSDFCPLTEAMLCQPP